MRDAVVGIILCEFPDNNGLVTGRRENHVGKHGSGRDLSDPPEFTQGLIDIISMIPSHPYIPPTPPPTN